MIWAAGIAVVIGGTLLAWALCRASASNDVEE